MMLLTMMLLPMMEIVVIIVLRCHELKCLRECEKKASNTLYIVCVCCYQQEFARAIEGFEERLVSVENNVHKEISAIKSIAETLLLSSNKQKDDAELSSAETRVVRLENCMEGILDRLDNISTSIASNNK